MDDYIKREDAINSICDECVEKSSCDRDADVCTDLYGLVKLPAADVVEVVRCKDCSVPHNKWTGCPKLNGIVPKPDFFCGHGERRRDDA